MVVFICVAVVGNLMVISVILRHKGMRTRTNMFLCNLAVADLLVGVLDMPFSLITVIKGDWIFGDTFCQFNGFTMPLFFIASIHTLMYISLHKCITIIKPFSRILTHKRILVMIGAAWFWAFVTGFVTVRGLNAVGYKKYTTQCGPGYPYNLRTYMHPVFMIVSNYLIPFVVMVYCYARMFREIRAHTRRVIKHTNQERDMIVLQQRRIAITLLMVLVTFVLSWTPYIIYSVYASMLKDKGKLPPIMNPIVYWFGYMNSACNPIIYALRSPAFREGYKEIMCQGQGYAMTDGDPKMIQPLIQTDTVPYDSSPGPLKRLRSLIRKSISGSASVPGSLSSVRVDGTNLRQNSLPGPNLSSLSTCSLPQAFRSGTAPSNRTPRVVVIGGIPVITVGGRIVYFKDIERERLRRKSSVPLPYTEKDQLKNGLMPLGNGVLKQLSRSDTDIECAKESLELSNERNSNRCEQNLSEPSPQSQEDSALETCEDIGDDDVFITVPVQHSRIIAGPDIKIVLEREPTPDDGPSASEQKQVSKSDSGQPSHHNQKDRDRQPLASSLKHIDKIEREINPAHLLLPDKSESVSSSKSGDSNFLRRLLSWGKESGTTGSIKSSTYSECSTDFEVNLQAAKHAGQYLVYPGEWRTVYLRSTSHEVKTNSQGMTGTPSNALEVPVISKAVSDTCLEHEHKGSWPKKLRNSLRHSFQKKDKKKDTLDVEQQQVVDTGHPEFEGVVVGTNIPQHKARVLRYPSVEHLDTMKTLRKRGSPKKNKHAKKKLQSSSDSDAHETKGKTKEGIKSSKSYDALLVENLTSLQKQIRADPAASHFDSAWALSTSVSDPCITFSLMKQTLARRALTSRRKKNRPHSCLPAKESHHKHEKRLKKVDKESEKMTAVKFKVIGESSKSPCTNDHKQSHTGDTQICEGYDKLATVPGVPNFQTNQHSKDQNHRHLVKKSSDNQTKGSLEIQPMFSQDKSAEMNQESVL